MLQCIISKGSELISHIDISLAFGTHSLLSLIGSLLNVPLYNVRSFSRAGKNMNEDSCVAVLCLHVLSANENPLHDLHIDIL